jgi:hypothetical protein
MFLVSLFILSASSTALAEEKADTKLNLLYILGTHRADIFMWHSQHIFAFSG